MNLIFIVGIVCSTLTTVSLLPQVFKLIKTKSADDLSFWTYVSLSTGTFLWVIYGIMLKQPPIYIANILTCAFSTSILVLKMIHK